MVTTSPSRRLNDSSGTMHVPVKRSGYRWWPTIRGDSRAAQVSQGPNTAKKAQPQGWLRLSASVPDHQLPVCPSVGQDSLMFVVGDVASDLAGDSGDQ
jgi:hypothetical protein